jgi:hypothetical protein
MSVMGDAFKRSFPPQHDLPQAMGALIAKLAAMESYRARAAGHAGKVLVEEKSAVRDAQTA